MTSRARPLTEPVAGAVEYDLLVVTAANRAQARGYEAELSFRERSGRLEGVRGWRVVPDPGDRRVGSGGSTLHILSSLAGEKSLRRGHVLIVHSGGDSRRLPAYAAQGKAFVPLPMEDERGRALAMFDLILADLRGMTLGARPRVVVAVGDVYLGLARHFPDMAGADVVGLAFPDSPARGSRHGVYVAAKDGRVLDFLQKPSVRLARERGAVRPDGRVLVDCGVVSLSERAVARLVGGTGGGRGLLERVVAGQMGPIDLYDQVLSAMVPQQAARTSRGRPGHRIGDAERRALQRFRRAVTGLSFAVRTIRSSDFLHIGTTRELLGEAARLQAAAPRRGDNCYVESSLARGPLRFGGRNVVVGVPEEISRIALPAGIGVCGIPVRARRWAFVVFGDKDDGKAARGRGGAFLNRSLERLPEMVWRGVAGARTSWNARLWIVGPARAAWADSLRWLKTARRDGKTRLSMEELLPRVNHGRLLALREEWRRRGNIATIAERISSSAWLASGQVTNDIRTAAEGGTAVRGLEHAMARADPLAGARLARVQHAVARKFPAAARAVGAGVAGLARRPFDAIASAVAMDAEQPAERPRRGILGDQVVWVTCPARIDLSGGWSDTPPICNEMGGSVVNAAITINGQYPVQAICRLTDRPVLRITSVDLGRSVTFESGAAIHRFDNPLHWSALPQAALAVAGIAPPDRRGNLSRWLRDFGGLDLTVFSALPKGSGLGTSSILGAAVLAALMRARGERFTNLELIRRTSLLEQFMRTGGGWQDQCGGIAPGVKLLTSAPGLEQSIRVEELGGGGCLGNAEARERVLLYYTGQRRLAKNILQNVVGRYLDREPEIRGILTSLKRGAGEMARAISEGTLREVAGALTRYWDLKKAIDPGTTNDLIEGIASRVSRCVDGLGIAGAGGGGFLVMIARDDGAARKIRRILARRPAAATARLYDWAIDAKGLHVTVL